MSSMATKKPISQRYVPLGLGLAMACLVGLAVLQGAAGGSSGVPAPAQYSSPPPNNGISALDVGVIGAGVAVLILAVLLLLLMRRRGGAGGAAGTTEESPEGGAGEAPEGAEDMAGGAGMAGEAEGGDTAAASTGGAGSDFSEDNEGSESKFQEGGEGGNEDLDDTLGELDKLAETANKDPPA